MAHVEMLQSAGLAGPQSGAIFRRELGDWYQERATAPDAARFERVLGDVESLAPEPEEAKKERQSAKLRSTMSRKPQQPVTLQEGEGWTHTATRAATARAAAHTTSGRPGTSSAPHQREQQQPATPPEGSRPVSQVERANQRELKFLVQAAQAHKQRVGTPPLPGGRPGTSAGAAAAGAAEGRGASAPKREIHPDDITTYRTFFSMRDDHPEIYNRAVEATRAEPAPNQTFKSVWGDSLKKADDSEWRKTYLKSTYDAINDQVATCNTASDKTKEAAYFEWMKKQKNYFGDLMDKHKGAGVQELLDSGSVEQKRELLTALRQMHAVARPDMLKSHSQTEHGPMVRVDDEAMRRELVQFTKDRNGGTRTIVVPPEAVHALYDETLQLVAGRGQQGGEEGEPSTSGPVPIPRFGRAKHTSADGQPLRPCTAPQGSQSRAPKPAPGDKRESTNAFKSQVPMKWATSGLNGRSSAYADQFGSRGQMNGGRRAISASGPTRHHHVFTCPIGAVNAATAIAPVTNVVPVPNCFLQHLTMPGPNMDLSINPTTQRTAYTQPRNAEEAARAVESNQEAHNTIRDFGRRSLVPVGGGGIALAPSKSWKSQTKATYTPQRSEHGSNSQCAEILKVMGQGTASGTRLTAVHPTTLRPT